MGPGSYGGIGATLGAVVVALIVLIVVAAMVSVGGGMSHPIVAHVATVVAAPSQG